MKTLIICFSQTGNTRKIAEYIGNGVKNVTGHCDLLSFENVKEEMLTQYDLIGIGSPVFYYKEPFHVRDFLESLSDLAGQHWFVFCTHGNVIGNFFPSMTDLLNGRNAQVIGFHDSYADITVPYYPKPSYTAKHPDAIDLEQAEIFGEMIANRSRGIINGEAFIVPEPGPVSSEEWIRDSHFLTRESLKMFMPKFSVNQETCIQCCECVDSCPVCGIDIENEPPRIQEPCIFCYRCYNVCPTMSIEADWTPLASKAAEYFARYKKELDKVTERGEFRWLIDPSAIDLMDPLFKQRKRDLMK